MIENLTVPGVLEFAVETERIGNEMYQKLAENHDHETELSGLFSRLADDERLHRAQLDELARTLDESQRRELTEREREYLRRISWAKVFHGDLDPLAVAERADNRDDALQIASNLERSTLIFYDACRDILGNEPVLEEIISMEKHHLTQIIKYMMDSDSKVRGAADTWI
jgi:rubrerythrin